MPLYKSVISFGFVISYRLINFTFQIFPDKAKEIVIGRACSMHGRSRRYIILIGKCVAKRPLRRPRCRWEDNSRMDLTREIYMVGRCGLDAFGSG
jgi:hypothetical protein